MRRSIGAFEYLECSAKTGEGVREVFRTAAAVISRIEALDCELPERDIPTGQFVGFCLLRSVRSFELSREKRRQGLLE